MDKKGNNVKILLAIAIALSTFSLNINAMENKKSSKNANILNKSFKKKEIKNDIFENLDPKKADIKKSNSVKGIKNNFNLDEEKQKYNKNIKKFNFYLKNLDPKYLNNLNKPYQNTKKELPNSDDIKEIEEKERQQYEKYQNKQYMELEKLVEGLNLIEKNSSILYGLIKNYNDKKNHEEIIKNLKATDDILTELISDCYENIENEERSKIISIISKYKETYKKIAILMERPNKINEEIVYLSECQIMSKLWTLIDILKDSNFNTLNKNKIKINKESSIHKKIEEIKNLIKFKEFKTELPNSDNIIDEERQYVELKRLFEGLNLIEKNSSILNDLIKNYNGTKNHEEIIENLNTTNNILNDLVGVNYENIENEEKYKIIYIILKYIEDYQRTARLMKSPTKFNSKIVFLLEGPIIGNFYVLINILKDSNFNTLNKNKIKLDKESEICKKIKEIKNLIKSKTEEIKTLIKSKTFKTELPNSDDIIDEERQYVELEKLVEGLNLIEKNSSILYGLIKNYNDKKNHEEIIKNLKATDDILTELMSDRYENIENEERSKIISIISKYKETYKKIARLMGGSTIINEKLVRLVEEQIMDKFCMLIDILKDSNFNTLNKNKIKINKESETFEKIKEIKNLIKFKEFKTELSNFYDIKNIDEEKQQIIDRDIKLKKLIKDLTVVEKNTSILNDLIKNYNDTKNHEEIIENLNTTDEKLNELINNNYENIENKEKSKIISIISKYKEDYQKIAELMGGSEENKELVNLLEKQIINKFYKLISILESSIKNSNFNILNKESETFEKIKEIKNLIKFKTFEKEYVKLFKNKDYLKNNIKNIKRDLKKEHTDLIEEFQNLNEYYHLKHIFITKLENTIRELEMKRSHAPYYKIADYAVAKKSEIEKELKILEEEASELELKRDKINEKKHKIDDTIDALECIIEKNLLNKEKINKIEKISEKDLELKLKNLELILEKLNDQKNKPIKPIIEEIIKIEEEENKQKNALIEEIIKEDKITKMEKEIESNVNKKIKEDKLTKMEKEIESNIDNKIKEDKLTKMEKEIESNVNKKIKEDKLTKMEKEIESNIDNKIKEDFEKMLMRLKEDTNKKNEADQQQNNTQMSVAEEIKQNLKEYREYIEKMENELHIYRENNRKINSRLNQIKQQTNEKINKDILGEFKINEYVIKKYNDIKKAIEFTEKKCDNTIKTITNYLLEKKFDMSKNNMNILKPYFGVLKEIRYQQTLAIYNGLTSLQDKNEDFISENINNEYEKLRTINEKIMNFFNDINKKLKDQRK